MSVSRPFLLVLIGVALLGATVFAVQQTRNNSVDSTSAPADDAGSQQAPAPAPAELSPEDALQAAFQSNVESARFDLDASVRAQGQSGSLELSGATDASAKQPAVEVDVKVDVPGTKVEGGFVTVDGKAYFVDGDTGYLVPEDVWQNVVNADEAENATGQADAAQLPFDPTKWVENVSSEGSETIDGVETEHVSASVDAPKAAKDIIGFAQQQAGGQAAAALPQNAVAQVEKAVKQVDFDVWVGKEDKILRRLTADVELAVPGAGAVTATLELNLTDVGEPQAIEPPAKVSTRLPSGAFGDFMRMALESSATATGGDPSLIRAGLQGVNNPQKLKKALRQNEKVVLFLANPRGLDDKAVETSVRSVKRETKAVVLTDLVVNIGRYGDLVESLGVNEVPAVVVIDTDGNARLIEGYVDGPSLVQVVTDAR